MSSGTFGSTPISRRGLLGIGLGTAAMPVLAACGGVSTSGAQGSGAVNFLSTQFTQIEEKQRFQKILTDKVKGLTVAFNAVQPSNFATTLQTQVDTNKVSVSLVGGLHGELAPHAKRLQDLDDLAGHLADRGFSSELTQLGKLGGSTVKYIPWMQASYVVAVNKKALQWLPSGADVQNLTYDQLLAWATAGKAGNKGKPIFGFPAGTMGLYHRFFQGYLLPSFTGGQITTFKSADAVQAWTYMKKLWAVTAPASTNYDHMQEPLARGEVLVAWDHVARLVDAPKDNPGDWQMVAAPRGPKGLGYMVVIVGLGIPRGAPETAKAKDAIKALTQVDTELEVLRQNAFFPTAKASLPSDLPAAVGLEAQAVNAQQTASGTVVALPPVGLGDKDGAVSQIFKNCFAQICLQNKPVQQVLDDQAGQLNDILNTLKVPCWKPDPTMQPCQVA
jgi:multiple sugar transport system substrate-binding protein